MKIRVQCWQLNLLICISVMSSGCTLGPTLMRSSRTNYNDALQRTASEEMLLNLVRARYGEPPEFLAVSGITSQFEIDGGLSFGTEFGLGSGRWAGNLNAADRPTISLSPIQDEQFTRRFLSPIGLDTIYLFSRNGQRLERVLRLTVDQINGVRNGTDSSQSAGAADAFEWLAATLGELARMQQIELAYQETTEQLSPPLRTGTLTPSDAVAALEKGYRFSPAEENQSVVLTKRGQELVLRFSPDTMVSAEAAAITDLLQLEPGQAAYPLEPAAEGQLKAVTAFHSDLHVSTRSVEEVLHFLSRGVEVPEQHLTRGLAEALPEDVTPACDLLQIGCSKRAPRDSSAAVFWRGYWFSLDAADGRSRETFELLLELYNLEIRGGGASTFPLLTLPVGR
ncbi:hypothetical protein GC176_22555 [bacterium]|nr:hypothetical protein [bacterium]